MGKYMLLFPLKETACFCVRLIIACLCGAAIGFERSKRFKEAGIRTHIIVCVGAALAMIVSKYGFEDLGGILDGSRTSDPARVAAQVVTGISFLGAGVIFKNGGTIKGLTTAACLWATASIGLAVGCGGSMIFIGVFSTILVAVLQILLHRYAVGADAYAANRLQFTVKNGYEFNRSLRKQLEDWGATIAESKVDRRKDGTTEYDITIRRKHEVTYDEMKAFMDAHGEILSASNSPLR